MATIHTLYQQGIVDKYGIDLARHEFEERHIYFSLRARDWIMNELPAQPKFYAETDVEPLEQFDSLAYRFIVGGSLTHWRDIHIMEPHLPGIWELKSPDLRLFGWFPERDRFVCAEIDSFERVKIHPGLASGYRNAAQQFRETLDLDEPKYLAGSNLSDVLSSPN